MPLYGAPRQLAPGAAEAAQREITGEKKVQATQGPVLDDKEG